jgi:diguanylate cyclase (GGDEF)-like protein
MLDRVAPACTGLAMPLRLPEILVSLKIRSPRELMSYVVRTTALCATVALAVDALNQLVFFESWPSAIRSWCITAGLTIAIAAPVSRAIGKAHLALYRAGQTDALTGLLNRRALLEGIEDRSTFMVLIIVDIDRFKAVNDTHGHLVGDEVLRTVARVLAGHFDGIARVGRLGGEEFALVSDSLDGRSVLQSLEAFRRQVAEMAIVTAHAAVRVTISAGVADRSEGQSFEQLYAEADRALYLAKAGGRNRIVLAGDHELERVIGVDRLSAAS